MERGVKHRPRRRSPLPFLLLAVAVVGCAFAVAVAAVVPMEADSHGGQDQALPTPTLEEAERDKLDAPAAATPTPTPAPYIPDEAEVEMLARLIWGEARGIPSDMHKAAVVWCVLNRVDAEGWPDTVAEVVTQPHQFAGYSPDYPATDISLFLRKIWPPQTTKRTARNTHTGLIFTRNAIISPFCAV